MAILQQYIVAQLKWGQNSNPFKYNKTW